jgi:DNA polymerase-3 subunit gamma/tau
MRGHDLRNFCRDLLAHFRDLLVTKVSNNEELLEAAVCEPQELKRQAALFSESDLVRFFHSLAETETKLRTATQPRYQLEVGIVKLMELRGVETMGEILARLAELETNISGETSSRKTPSGSAGGSTTSGRGGTERPPTSSRSTGASFVATGASLALESPSDPPLSFSVTVSAESQPPVLSGDASPIERIKAALESQRKMFLVTVLESAQSTRLDGDELHIEFSPESRHFRDTLSKPENIKILRDACKEVTGKETGVRIAVKDPQAESQPLTKDEEERLEKQRLRASAENNPIVQEMLKTFRGEIVDVRRVDGDG